jgi:glycosyltransferase involved in cell wall biosynthesis
MTVDLSIIICTFNRYDVLTEAIAAVEQQDLDAQRFELLIIDNSSDKNAQSQYREGLDIVCQHRYLVEDTPGLSRARNRGVRAAAAPIVAFMDDDARPSLTWASAIVATFAAADDAAIVGGPVRPIWPSGRPSWLHEWLEGFLTIVDRGPVMRELQPGEWLAGTNIAFRKDLLEQAGLFEENLGRIGRLLLSNEELKISDRIRSLGYKTLYVPELEMRHHVHADRITQAWMRRRVFWQTVSDLFVTGGGAESSFDQDVELLLSFLAELPRRHRGPSGLFVDLDEPAMFHKQTQALSAMIRLVATEGQTLEHFVHHGPRG